MKKLFITAFIAVLCISAFGQLDIVKRDLTATREITIRDTTLLDFVKKHGGSSVTGLTSDSLNFGSDLLQWDRVNRTYKHYTFKPSGLGFYTGITAPDGTDRLNLNGAFHATNFVRGGINLLPFTTTNSSILNLSFSSPTLSLSFLTSKPTGLGFYTGTTDPDGTTRLNLNGQFYAQTFRTYGAYTITNTYLYEDSSNIRNAITKWHRTDSINNATANVWRNVKFKTNVSDESTYGIKPNTDSTGFVFNTIGVYRVSGCGHWTWFGAAGTEAKIYIRATQDGTELRCTQTNDTKTLGSAATGSMRYEGTFRITTPGQVIRVQQRVDNASMDWQGSSVFDSPVSFTVNFQKISR